MNLATQIAQSKAMPDRSPQALRPLVQVTALKKHFPVHQGFFSRVSGQVYAVDGVSFELRKGETLGLVGESGCGKSTVGRTVLKLLEPTAGEIKVDGRDITHLDQREMLAYRRRLQMIYQDPYASLNPRMTAGEIVAEPLIIHEVGGGTKERADRVASLFQRVGLRPEAIQSYPHQFSGGQRQRIGIARAILKNAPIIVLDEATSALDTESEREIQFALEELVRGRTVIAVAHRLSTLVSFDRIVVIENGRIIEDGSPVELRRRGGVFDRLWRLQADGLTMEEPLRGAAD